MKIPAIKRLNREEIGAPSWFDAVLSSLNLFMERVILALSNRITFADNIACEIKELTFVHNVELKLSTKINIALGGLPLLSGQNDISSDVITGFKLRNITNGTVGVTVQFSGALTTTAKVKFLILGG